MTPPNCLKKLILNSIELGNHLSEDIINYVLITPYFYEDEEYFYGGGIGGIRSGITAMKIAGYLTLYPKDEQGNSLQIKPKRPFNYYLTALGAIHSVNPFIKKDIRDQHVLEEAIRMRDILLADEPKFKEYMDRLFQKNKTQNVHITPSPNVTNPRNSDQTVVNNTLQGIAQDEYDGVVKELETSKSKVLDFTNKMISQQWQMAGYEQQIADFYYALEGKDITLSNIQRRNTGAMRVAQRKDLVYTISGINPNELDCELPVEIPVGADFFNIWGSIWGRKVKGATLLKRASFELMSDTNPEVERGHANHELDYTEMDAVGMFISKMRSTGITVDAISNRMFKAIALNW